MRTGLKTLAKKIINFFKYPKFLYPQTSIDMFPNTPTIKLKAEARLFGVKNELNNHDILFNLGALHTIPHIAAVKAYQSFLKLNPNHLGSWSSKEPKYGSEQLEYEVIKKMVNLYHAQKAKIEGYITSGGTEGNIYSLWLGRTQLEKLSSKDSICLLKTSLTHYSVTKAGNICNVPQFLIPLNVQEWNIDRKGLIKTTKDLYKKGYRGFILPLTIGYTSTGTHDNIQNITNTVSDLKKELKNINFFVWIDAAFNGLIEPFINIDFKPFWSSHIQAIVADFHKFGMTPYSTGIVLYRKNLRNMVEQDIDYLNEKDNTLLGSRQGAAASSIWRIIHHFGRSGYKKIILKQLKNKKYFIENIKKIFPSVEIITNKNSLTCGVIFHSQKNQRLSVYLEEKYWLYPGKTSLLFENNVKKTQVIYKFIFLPHLEKNILEMFFLDFKKILYL